ncbi:MAG TPA: spore germination protein [Bacillota bacterium]|nr:spore germination protein [Bacillota bacterium]
MPSVVGAVNINDNSGTFNVGDVLNISPKSNTKTFQGQGGGSIGNIINEVNGVNSTNSVNANGVDQPVAGNL